MFIELWIMELTFAIWIIKYIWGGFYVQQKHRFVWIKENVSKKRWDAIYVDWDFKNVVQFQYM